MNKSSSIPIGMLVKKFYCHKCGARLEKHSNTRTVRRGDPDYRKYGRTYFGTHIIGDIEVTEYDFRCPDCGNIIEYDEQRIIGKVQKKLCKNVLHEEEISDNRGNIQKAINRNGRILQVLFSIVVLAIIALFVYLKIKSGDFSFKVYL